MIDELEFKVSRFSSSLSIEIYKIELLDLNYKCNSNQALESQAVNSLKI